MTMMASLRFSAWLLTVYQVVEEYFGGGVGCFMEVSYCSNVLPEMIFDSHCDVCLPYVVVRSFGLVFFEFVFQDLDCQRQQPWACVLRRLGPLEGNLQLASRIGGCFHPFGRCFYGNKVLRGWRVFGYIVKTVAGSGEYPLILYAVKPNVEGLELLEYLAYDVPVVFVGVALDFDAAFFHAGFFEAKLLKNLLVLQYLPEISSCYIINVSVSYWFLIMQSWNILGFGLKNPRLETTF